MYGSHAVVVLEDGLVLSARNAGSSGTRTGEMVFATAMSGYQEAVTDPSYLGQILCFAAPMIGNYGTGPGFSESERVWPEAVIMRVAGDLPGAAGQTGWRTWLAERDVVAVEDCDTRRLIRHLRDHGAMRGGVSTELGAEELLALVRAAPTLDGRDLAAEASGARRSLGADGPVVVAVDCGMKASIASELVRAGARVEVVAPDVTVDQVLAFDPQALFLSNGPGDPAAVANVVELTRGLLGQVPIFGICLGHQLLARALDLTTAKLPFGHRGANHPVLRTDDGRVEVTVQNHGYAVELPSEGRDGIVVTRTSLFDGSVEGIAAPELRAWSVQYHPEARPGPNDAAYLFADFVERVS